MSMYRTRSEQVGRNRSFDDSEVSETRKKKRSLQLSSLGALVMDRIALGRDDGSPMPDRHSFEVTGEVVCSEFLVCGGGLCVPTHGPLRLEEHLGVHYVLGRSTWQRCESATHAEQRLAWRINELDPHDLASEALALADPGFD